MPLFIILLLLLLLLCDQQIIDLVHHHHLSSFLFFWLRYSIFEISSANFGKGASRADWKNSVRPRRPRNSLPRTRRGSVKLSLPPGTSTIPPHKNMFRPCHHHRHHHHKPLLSRDRSACLPIIRPCKIFVPCDMRRNSSGRSGRPLWYGRPCWERTTTTPIIHNNNNKIKITKRYGCIPSIVKWDGNVPPRRMPPSFDITIGRIQN
jgi:hypothetical protein